MEYQESELKEKHTRIHFNASTPKINNLLQPATVLLIEQVLQSKVVLKISPKTKLYEKMIKAKYRRLEQVFTPRSFNLLPS